MYFTLACRPAYEGRACAGIWNWKGYRYVPGGIDSSPRTGRRHCTTVAFDRYVTAVFPALRVMTVCSVPVKSTYSPRLETSGAVSIPTVPSITVPVKYEVRGSSTAISRGVDSPQIGMPHRTRNRVPQQEQVAMPKRSTLVGGPPQFGQ